MTFNLILRSIGRVILFAAAGAVYMAIVGVFSGAIAGRLLSTLIERFAPLASMGNASEGSKFGALVALYISPFAGLLAFAIAGLLSCQSKLPSQVFAKTFRLAWRASLVGVAIGGALGTINALIFGRFFFADFDAATRLFIGCVLGVIGGFIIGTFYGAIVGAKREIARQKAETKAALSIAESAASEHRVLDSREDL